MFNWAAGFIALLILAAFLWPQSKLSPEKTINPFDDNNIPAVDSKKIDRTSSFTKETDSSRAQSFRESEILEHKIRVLLDEAQALTDKQFYTLPKERNAILVYQEVLELSPYNSVATQGIEFISEQLFIIGKRSLANNKLNTANRILQKLININGESEQTVKLTSEISAWHESREWRDLVQKGNQAFSDQAYITPATKNALYYYEQALLINPSNKTAKAGIKKITNIYLQRSQAAIAKSDYSQASTNLEILTAIDPNHSSIANLHDTIEQAKQINQQLNNNN